MIVKTPVVILVYNRLETVKALLARLQGVTLTALYVIADGPKDKEDARKCQSVLDYMKRHTRAKKIVWFGAKAHLGLKKRVISGLDAVFAEESEAIILEDDCIPDLSFFPFTEELLAMYKNDTRIMGIAGYTSWPRASMASYTFSKFIESWGWATWRRAWQSGDLKMTTWQKYRRTGWLKKYLGSTLAAKYWQLIFDLTASPKSESWAYRFMYKAFETRGLTIVPKANLIENIGFGKHATHTKIKAGKMQASSLAFPLVHPQVVAADPVYDRRYMWDIFTNPLALVGLIKTKVNSLFGKS